jgi:hypothetical protein
MAFSSGIGANPPYSGPDFRVAQVAFCVVAPGLATLHWQFSPPDPPTRDTAIINSNGILVQTRACYVDYTVNIPSPTDTPTATPTATPTGPTLLVGHVIWQAIPQNNSRSILPLTLTLKMGAVEVNYPRQTTEAMGFFTVSVAGLPNGTYQWRVQGPDAVPGGENRAGFLARSGAVTLAGGPQTNLENGTMKGADANNDDVVNVLDFNILKNSFGQAGITLGDFDNNTVANSTDFNILKGNFGVGGAPPP